MGETLGAPRPAGGMAAVIYGKGGTPQVAAPGRLNQATWSRVLDGTSEASVVIPAAGNRCAELVDVEPWSHELALFRNQDLVWEGPIYRVEDDRAAGAITIQARDVTAWLPRRICKGYTTVGLTEDLAETAKRMLRQALLEDDPGLIHWLTTIATGLTAERIVEANETYAMSDLKQLAGLGLNFTAVGRRILLFGANRPLVSLRRLTDNHFTGALPVVRTDRVTTRATLLGDGVTGTFGGVSARYGLLEELGREDGVLEELALQRGAKARVNARPPTIIDAGQAGSLKPGAPIRIGDLVPGAWGELAVRGNCGTTLQLMRLEQLQVNWSPGKEQVRPTFAPLNDYSEVA